MARKIGDLCFPAGKYHKDGEEKTRWMNVGVLLETDKGMRIKLDAIPVVTDPNGLWLSVFEPREQTRSQGGFREKPAPAATQATDQGDIGQEDVPF